MRQPVLTLSAVLWFLGSVVAYAQIQVISPQSSNTVIVAPDGLEAGQRLQDDSIRAIYGSGAVTDISLSPSGERMLVLTAQGVEVFGRGSGTTFQPQLVSRLIADRPVTAGVMESENDVIVGFADGSLVRWTVSSGAFSALNQQQAAITALARGGNRTLAGTAGGQVISVRGNDTPLITSVSASVNTIAVARSADQAVVGTFADLAGSDPRGEVYHVDVAGGEVTRLYSHVGDVLASAITSDGQTVATSGMENWIRLMTLEDDEAVIQGAHFSWVMDMAFSPDDTYLYSTGLDGDVQIWEWNHELDAIELVIAHGDVPIFDMAVAPDGAALFLNIHERDVTGYRTQPLIDEYQRRKNDESHYAETAEQKLAQASPDRSRIHTVTRWTSPILSFATSQSGDVVVTGHVDGSIFRWQNNQGSRLGSSPRGINAVAVSSDGSRTAVAGANGDVLQFDGNSAAGQTQVRLAGGEPSSAFSVALLGNTVLLGEYNRMLTVSGSGSPQALAAGNGGVIFDMAAGGGSVYAVGTGGPVFRFDGSTTSQMSLYSQDSILGVSAHGDGRVIAALRNGRVVELSSGSTEIGTFRGIVAATPFPTSILLAFPDRLEHVSTAGGQPVSLPRPPGLVSAMSSAGNTAFMLTDDGVLRRLAVPPIPGQPVATVETPPENTETTDTNPDSTDTPPVADTSSRLSTGSRLAGEFETGIRPAREPRIASDGQRIVVYSTRRQILGFDDEAESLGEPVQILAKMFRLHDGAAYIWGNGGASRINLDGMDQVWSLDSSELGESYRWSNSGMVIHDGNPVYSTERGFMMLNAANGEVIWQVEHDQASRIPNIPVLIGDLMVGPSEFGTGFVAVDVSDEGSIAWTTQTGRRTNNQVALAVGNIVGNLNIDGRWQAVDVSTQQPAGPASGVQVASADTPDLWESQVTVFNERFALCTSSGVVLINPANSQIEKRFEQIGTPCWLESAGSTLLVNDSDKLVALNQDFESEWSWEGSNLQGNVVVMNQRAYVFRREQLSVLNLQLQ